MAEKPMRTVAEYDRLFQKERKVAYPVIDALEARLGYALDRDRLENMARVLACPVKVRFPNWQHGRVLYAIARAHIDQRKAATGTNFFDVGTAKGFSALCLAWAIHDARLDGTVTSVDVVDPAERRPRNSIRDLEEQFPTVTELVTPFVPSGVAVKFVQGTADTVVRSLINISPEYTPRFGVAFIDGKHTYDGAAEDARVMALGQEPGDVIVFDDVQVPGVMQAARELQRDKRYDLQELAPLHERRYMIATRR